MTDLVAAGVRRDDVSVDRGGSGNGPLVPSSMKRSTCFNTEHSGDHDVGPSGPLHAEPAHLAEECGGGVRVFVS